MRKNIFSKIFIIILIIVAFFAYRKYDYNFYSKGVTGSKKTSFSRDSKITTNKKKSYKVENKDYTDAMFFKKIEVKKYTPYKISCMVKTENVEQFEGEALAGAQIVLKGTEEHSDVISGTNEWTKLEFCFNSKCNESVEIGFRLGGNDEKAKGIAWFSDLQIEEGFLSDDTTWNFICFAFDNVDVQLEGNHITGQLSKNDIYNLNDSMRRLKETLPDLCGNKMQVEYTIIEIQDPITSLTYDEENGYYVGEKDIYNLVKNYMNEAEYDHVFAYIKLPDEAFMTNADVTNWIGLGNMQYCGKGYSNIRVSDTSSQDIYRYSSSNNFPEEVFIHEFLHTLERNAQEYGYEIPELHSSKDYGYEESRVDGLRIWYADYMNKKINSNGTYIGLPEDIYKYTPAQVSDFEYSSKLTLLDEPKNIVETIRSILARVEQLFNRKEQNIEIKGIAE